MKTFVKIQVRLWVAAALALMATNVWAAVIDADQAARAATQFALSHGTTTIKGTPVSMRLAFAEPSQVRAAAADYYVFNAENGNSFIIVAGDDRAQEVLGYGEGRLEQDNLPEGLQWLLGHYKNQMEYLHATPLLVIEEAPMLTETLSIAPLLTCNWSQSEPYWNQCPVINGERCVTGCIATAMAQVMYYWRFPAAGVPLEGYTTRGGPDSPSFDVEPLPGAPFDWDNMIDSYLGEYTEVQSDAVATVMRYCGQSSTMDYGPNGSGAYVRGQLWGMKVHGYNPGATSKDRRGSNTSRWKSMMLAELTARRPILYAGQDAKGGHAFVLDGYFNDRFHINWGWAATGNGYFALDAFNVRDYMFNDGQEMIIDLYPYPYEEHETLECDFEADGLYYRILNGEASIASRDNHYNAYSGEMTIPAYVEHDGATYLVTAVADNAFRDCIDLTGVTIPATVTSIGKYAFRNCRSLTAITLPEHLTTVGEQAFSHCSNLTAITLPDEVTTIGMYAFEECRALTEVTLSASLTRIDASAFDACVGLKRVNAPDVSAWLRIRFVDRIANPLLHAHSLYLNGQKVQSLAIPGTFSEIHDFAFVGSDMTEVTIGEGVERIGRMAFLSCSGLNSITFAGTISEMGDNAFNGCSALKTVSLPQSMNTVSKQLFANCASLTSIGLPEGLTTISENAFDGCGSLTSITIPALVNFIGMDAFNACSALTEVHAADLKAWCGMTFGNNQANPLKTAHHLFVDGVEVKNLVIPPSVTQVKAYTFSGASGIETLMLGNQVTGIGRGAFSLCKGLTDVTIDGKVKTIGSRAFSTCTALERVTIGDAVETLGDSVFYCCYPLTDVVLGSGIKRIGKLSFMMCSDLTNLTCKAVVPPTLTNWMSFDNYTKPQVIVPRQSVAAYKAAEIWKRFTHITGAVFVVKGDVNGDGEVNIADINAIIGTILDGDDNPAFDVNGDGEVGLADINTVIDIILNN